MKTHHALVLGPNLDTDQILTAEFMKFDPSSPQGRVELAKRAFCGLPAGHPAIFGNTPGQARFSLVLAGENFGCGSSREHAPVAMGAAGIRLVVAPSFARIFFRNCLASGQVLPLVAPELEVQGLPPEVDAELDLAANSLKIRGRCYRLQPLGELQAMVDAGGLFAYARRSGRLKSPGARSD